MNRRPFIFATLFVPMTLGLGQISPIQRSLVSLESYAQTWHVEGTNEEQVILEWGTPISLFLPVGERGQVRMASSSSGYYSYQIRRTALASADSSTSLVGLTNFRIEGDWALSPQVLLGGNISLPTGRTELNEEELQAVALFLKPELASRLPRPGSGFDFGCQLSAVRLIGADWLGGGAIGYQNRGAYTPHDGGAEINPSDELLLNVALEYSREGTKGRAAIAMTTFGSERAEGSKHFKSGDKYEFLLSGFTRIRETGFWGSFHHIRRNTNRIGSSLSFEPENSHGPYTLVRFGANEPLGQVFHLLAFFEGRWLGKNGYGKGAASVFGGGLEGALIFRASELRLHVSYYEGETDDGTRDLRGLSSSLRFVFLL